MSRFAEETVYYCDENMVSTGYMYDNVTGQYVETFENKLPPPNTTKGALTRDNLDQVHPRLIHLNGGVDHSREPIERKEQFADPVGPDVSFDMYSKVLQHQAQFASRDLYNNQNGNYSVQGQISRETPWGYDGMQPNFRFLPHMPQTHQLSTDGRQYGSDSTSLTDITQHQGEISIKKNPALLSRSEKPTNLRNGVEAVSLIPIVRQSDGDATVQTYIPTIASSEFSAVVQGSQSSTNTKRDFVAPISHPQQESTQVLVSSVSASLKPEQSLMVAPTAPVSMQSDPLVLLKTFNNKVEKVNVIPTSHASIEVSSNIIAPINESHNQTFNAAPVAHINQGESGQKVLAAFQQSNKQSTTTRGGALDFNTSAINVPSHAQQSNRKLIAALPTSHAQLQTKGQILKPHMQLAKTQTEKTAASGNLSFPIGDDVSRETKMKLSTSSSLSAPVANPHKQSLGQTLAALKMRHSHKQQQQTPSVQNVHLDSHNKGVLKPGITWKKYAQKTLPARGAHLENNSHNNLVSAFAMMPVGGRQIVAPGRVNEAQLEKAGHFVQANIAPTKKTSNGFQTYVTNSQNQSGDVMRLNNHQFSAQRGQMIDYVKPHAKIPIDAGMVQHKMQQHQHRNEKQSIDVSQYVSRKEVSYLPSPKFSSIMQNKRNDFEEISLD